MKGSTRLPALKENNSRKFYNFRISRKYENVLLLKTRKNTVYLLYNPRGLAPGHKICPTEFFFTINKKKFSGANSVARTQEQVPVYYLPNKLNISFQQYLFFPHSNYKFMFSFHALNYTSPFIHSGKSSMTQVTFKINFSR